MMEFLKSENRKRNPKDSSNLLSQFLLWYMKDSLSSSAKGQFNKDDIFKICEEDSSLLLSHKLKRQWEKELRNRRPSLFTATWNMALPRVWIITICILIMNLAKLSQAIFLQQLIKNLSKSADDVSENYNKKYYWAVGLCASMILIWSLWHQTFLAAEKLGLNMRSAVRSLVYQKTLKLYNGSVSSITDSHVITLLSTEAQKIQEMFSLLYFLLAAPVMVCVSTYILWREFGAFCLVGICLLLSFIPIQLVANKTFTHTKFKASEQTDKRIDKMDELIRSMKLTKMYTWEDSFADVINTLRNEESRKFMRTGIVRAFSYTCVENSAYLACFTLFALFYFCGRSEHLSLSGGVLVVAVFFSIRTEVVFNFPMAIQLLNNGRKGCRKIETYLQEKEINPFEMKTICEQMRASRMPSVNFEKVTATWSEGDFDPVLKSLSFKVDSTNNLLMIVGPCGSGKSSILAAALNEVIVQKGRVDVNGSISYCPQQPWIYSGTVRQNIIFGKSHNKGFYEKVIKACGLSDDLEELSEGDMTLVGEKGTELNKSQQAKIGIARALYHDADIYLFDDALSAIDNKTGKEIFQKCMKGILKKKIILLVTRQIPLLEHATNILCLQNNGEFLEGSLNELSQQGVNLVSLLHPEPEEKWSDGDSAIETEDSIQFLHPNDQISQELSGIYLDAGNKLRESMRTSSQASLHTIKSAVYEDDEENTIQRKTLPSNNRTIVKYIVLGIGCLKSLMLLLSLPIGQVLFILTDYWLLAWTQSKEEITTNQTTTFKYIFKVNPDNNFYVLLSLTCGAVFWNILRTLSLWIGMAYCGRFLHNLMFEAVLRAPMYFFNTTTTGKILSRFSRDLNMLDEHFPWTFNGTVQMAVLAVGIVVVNCVSVPYLLIICLPVLITLLLLRRYHIKSAIEIRRLEGVSQNPFYNHVTSCLVGLTTIRAFNNQEKVLSNFHASNDYQVEAMLMQLHIDRWLLIRMDMMVTLFSCFAVFAPLVTMHYTDLDMRLVAMSWLYVVQLPAIVQGYVQESNKVDAAMEAAERCFEYARLEPEVDDGESKELRDTWPEYGLITAEGASFAYHTTLPYVLKKLFFCIRPSEKVGIVGRTGAGKGSLLNMLFRLGNTTGTVRIDGYPIEDLALNDLRKAISLIPQEPILFSATLRKNLDPSSIFLDADIWEALEEVQMKDVVMELKNKLDTEIMDSGCMFSVGERQLLFLARALLMQNKILVIDEVSSGVNYDTVTLINRVIREKFLEVTVMTVAHRLNTVMDCDRVMVINGGKVVEFDEPYELLQNESGYFRKLVDEAGRNEAARLKILAEESKQFRHLQLLQTQAQYPGWHITTSKTKAEIIQHFGTKVLYETTV